MTAMNEDDIDSGPCRKTRTRKRSPSHYGNLSPSACRQRLERADPVTPPRDLAKSPKRPTPTKISPIGNKTWFESSFAGVDHSANANSSNRIIKYSSTPSSKKIHHDICDDPELFESSDMFLADLDITQITTQCEVKSGSSSGVVLTKLAPCLQHQEKTKSSQYVSRSSSEEISSKNSDIKGKPSPDLYETPPDETLPNENLGKHQSRVLFQQETYGKKSQSPESIELFSNSPIKITQLPAPPCEKPESRHLGDGLQSEISEPTEKSGLNPPTSLNSPERNYLSDCDIFSSTFSPVIDDSALETNNNGSKKTPRNIEKKKEELNSIKADTSLSKRKKTDPSSLLRKNIRQRLFQNAQGKSSQNLAKHVQQLQQERLAEAKADIETMQKEKEAGQAAFDIGPFYGLPSKVKQLFESQRGIKQLYDWQKECLSLPALTSGRNLIYSLPTSGGKTLVAEILILRQLLCQKKNAMLILPYVSIVQEKVKSLSELAVELDFLVEEYAGSKGRYPPTKRRNKSSLYVATIEKSHSLINQFIELDRMDSLGLIVVDELHMLGEGGSRGAVLEATLIKALAFGHNCQIIGMSATLNNIEDLKTFLNADLYTNDFRPVSLTEFIKLEENIFRVAPKSSEDILVHDRVTTFQYKTEMCKTDPDHLLGLVLEVVPKNSCLLFCPTKKNCENVATMLCKMMSKYKRNLLEHKKTNKKQLLRELKIDNNGRLCPVLANIVPFGLAYHHSGLTTDERKLIEEAYSVGTLCLLACTSTLAAGVNLPAKRVILRSPYVGKNFLSRCQYMQMVGRAGRAGIDTSGESILIVPPHDKLKVCELVSGPLESCHSSLMYNEGKGIRLLILSLIGLQMATDISRLFAIINNSLLSVQSSVMPWDVNEETKTCLQSLLDLGLVVQKRENISSQEHNNEEETTEMVSNLSLEITTLGKATYKGSIDIDIAPRLYKDLMKATDMFVLSNYLHLLALITPYDLVANISPSWIIYFNQMSTLTPEEIAVASVMGVPEGYVARKASSQVIKQSIDRFVVDRFYLTLMLLEIWKQKSIWEVAEIFQQPRGFIQNLVSSAGSFATCTSHFCMEIEELWSLQALLTPFIQRLSYSVITALIPLLEIPGVKKGRAHQLLNAGYKTLSLVAQAKVEDLVKNIEYMSRKVAKQIVASAKLLLEEKREALLEEIEQLVTVPSVGGQGLNNEVNQPSTAAAATTETAAAASAHLLQDEIADSFPSDDDL